MSADSLLEPPENRRTRRTGRLQRTLQFLGHRGRLLVAVLFLCTLPLLVASLILPSRVQSAMREAGEQHLIQIAKGLADLTQNDLQRHLEAARSFASVRVLSEALRRHNEHPLAAPELAAVNDQLAQLLLGLSAERYQGMFLCDRDGTVCAGVLRNGDALAYVGLDIRDRAYFQQVRDRLEPRISDPLTSKVGGVPIVVVAAPLLDEQGAFAGLLGLSIEVQPLTSTLVSQKIGVSGYPLVVDGTGMVIGHPDPARVYDRGLGQPPGVVALSKRMTRGERGVQAYTLPNGVSKVAAFHPVPIAGWSVAASISTSEFEAPAQSLRRIIFVMVGACAVIGTVVTLIFAFGLEALQRSLGEARASEQRFRRFALVANQTIWDWDLDTDKVWWTGDLQSAQGDGEGQWEPSREAFLQRIPEPDRQTVIDGITSCFSGVPWSGEHHFRRGDGTSAYVMHRAVAIRDEAGMVVRVVGGMTDITRRRAIEEKLSEQAALIDQASDGIMVRDLDGTIRFWNSGAQRLFGWNSADVVGRRSCELFKVDPQAFAAADAQVQAAGQWTGRLSKTAQDGSVRLVESRWTLLRDRNGLPRSVLVFATDITEREQMETKFLRAQRLESIGTLAGGIAHDLNNLLAPIVMGVGMLKPSHASAEDREVIGWIEQSANRGTQLVKQILSFARGLDGARVSVHVGYVVREVEEMMRSTLPKNITLRAKVPRDLWLITADPTQINQILVNLCVNARDAMPQGGQLSIGVKNVRPAEVPLALAPELKAGPYVLIEVEDTGIGMSRDVMARLFEPFFTTKEPGKGTGLGLSTVIGITRSHGGTIHVSSEPGRGAAFRVYLPATGAEAESASRPAVAEASSPTPRGMGELVLLVDDEASVRSATERVLSAAGYQVLVAADGAEAVALFHLHRDTIALVLTDMMMPTMDGPALVAAIRKDAPELPIVGVSGLGEQLASSNLPRSGNAFFLQKPYPAAELLAVLRRALESRGAAS